MKSSPSNLEQIFETQIQTLALTLRPGTVNVYRSAAHCFLDYLHTAFPQVRRLSQLRRDPHLLGWFRWLCEHQPPLCNGTRILYLIRLRRLLEDLAANGQSLPRDLIRREDFPPQPHYLPRALSLQDDQLLQQELRRIDDLYANALLLTRATGIRIGECLDLPLDCVRQLGSDQWALHVPLGKLHNERFFPADPELRRIVERILALRDSAPSSHLANAPGLLLPRRGSRDMLYQALRQALAQTAQRAGCSGHVKPHQMRHTFATEMLRLGVSLPALMQLLGHQDIRMTMLYLLVTQQDLQREFHQARQNAVHSHRPPTLSPPKSIASADIPGIRQALAAARHLLEMYRRQRADEKTQHKLARLARRLGAVLSQLDQIDTDEK